MEVVEATRVTKAEVTVVVKVEVVKEVAVAKATRVVVVKVKVTKAVKVKATTLKQRKIHQKSLIG